MSRRHPKDLVLENLEVTDAAAQGKSVAHSEDGRAVLILGAVPGDKEKQVLRRYRGTYRKTFGKTHDAAMRAFRGVRRLQMAKHGLPLAAFLQTKGSREQPAPSGGTGHARSVADKRLR